ncbi:hypothetical protein CC86DRAFT_417624 [Ophiobolus disseminans]|uniref:Uncharacterized protein n=1 Tax=Ophiobolus disseminans TaxID=1469910 RepID=A0A6A7A0P4_9PLEO|nr:hypothetical protein CC86DRAFT_417624 [Ophiobolus disseminans]
MFRRLTKNVLVWLGSRNHVFQNVHLISDAHQYHATQSVNLLVTRTRIDSQPSPSSFDDYEHRNVTLTSALPTNVSTSPPTTSLMCIFFPKPRKPNNVSGYAIHIASRRPSVQDDNHHESPDARRTRSRWMPLPHRLSFQRELDQGSVQVFARSRSQTQQHSSVNHREDIAHTNVNDPAQTTLRKQHHLGRR